MLKYFQLVIILLISIQIACQIDLTNNNLGLGVLNPQAPIHMMGDVYKLQNEAGSDLLFMNSQGNIGLGTTQPAHKLHVMGNGYFSGRNLYLGSMKLYGDNSTIINYSSNHSTITQFMLSDKEGTPYGRLYGDGNGQNFGLLDGDGNWSYVAVKDNFTEFRINNVSQMRVDGGSISMKPSQLQIGWNNTGNRYAYIDLVGDDTYNDYGLRLIRNPTGPNTTSSLIHRGAGPLEIKTFDQGHLQLITKNLYRMTIRGDNGKVGIGTTSPSQLLHVNGNIQYAGSIINASDKRLKKNIDDLKYGLNEVLKLNPVSYQYNELVSDNSDVFHIGVIAQELKKIAPELVMNYELSIGKDSESQTKKSKQEYLVINESAIKYLLINAIKNQQKQLDLQKKMIEEIQSLVEDHNSTELSDNDINITLGTLSTEHAFLLQNIPNPSDQNTSIEYYIPENAMSAMIRFFNLNGQILKEVPIYKNGQGIIHVNFEDIISGSYLYSLIVDHKLIDTKTMIITK